MCPTHISLIRQSHECIRILMHIRWLLLDFKGEFELEDSIRLFEILGSHHLELTSDKAIVATDKAMTKCIQIKIQLYMYM